VKVPTAKPRRGEYVPRPTEDMLVDRDAKVPRSLQPQDPDSVPVWVAYDRKVLRFFGYFKETVDGSPAEHYRIRICVFFYYLEDDTMHIAEPRQTNSGITQGYFVKRHRLEKPGGKGYYVEQDLKVGMSIEVYGKVFKLYDCDDSTRKFYAEELKTPQPKAEVCPEDNFGKSHKVIKKAANKMMNPVKLFMEARLGKFIHHNTKSFLENDRKVLRFFCRWDDTSVYGETNLYILNYYLADATVEVLMIKEQNSGRDPFPALLKRQKLPKSTFEVTPSIINIGALGEGVEYYDAKDFVCGKKINVFNREIQLCACDKFTVDYYQSQFGIDQHACIPLLDEKEVKRPPMVPPPHNGFGSEEDSLGSVLSLVPKAPKMDYKKYNENSRTELRFLAKFAKPQLQDMDREFIVTFYMATEKIGIYEKAKRNSGFIGGKFLERMKVKNHKTGKWYQPKDFRLGALLEMHKYTFKLYQADEFTLKYMEEKHANFPHASIDAIQKILVTKLRGKVKGTLSKLYIKLDLNRDGYLSYKEFDNFLKKSGIELNEHEIVTLCRRFDLDKNGVVDFVEFQKLVRDGDVVARR